MFLDDPFQYFGGAGMIPRPVRVDHCNGPVTADAKAVGFGAIDLARCIETEFLQASLQVLPRFQAGLFGAALGNGLIAA